MGHSQFRSRSSIEQLLHRFAHKHSVEGTGGEQPFEVALEFFGRGFLNTAIMILSQRSEPKRELFAKDRCLAVLSTLLPTSLVHCFGDGHDGILDLRDLVLGCCTALLELQFVRNELDAT